MDKLLELPKNAKLKELCKFYLRIHGGLGWENGYATPLPPPPLVKTEEDRTPSTSRSITLTSYYLDLMRTTGSEEALNKRSGGL